MTAQEQPKKDQQRKQPESAGQERIKRAQDAGLDARTGAPVEKRPASGTGLEYR